MAVRTELGVLIHLLEVCRDGTLGFGFAAQHACNPDLRDLFTTLADERTTFAQQLVPHVHRLGGLGLRDGTAPGAAHRGWMALKNSLVRDQDGVLVAEAERGERAALQAYDDALEGLLPPTVTNLVEQQRTAIRLAHDRLVALAYAATHQS
jgi:uncharacterized protein (TIGR02284 family)